MTTPASIRQRLPLAYHAPHLYTISFNISFTFSFGLWDRCCDEARWGDGLCQVKFQFHFDGRNYSLYTHNKPSRHHYLYTNSAQKTLHTVEHSYDCYILEHVDTITNYTTFDSFLSKCALIHKTFQFFVKSFASHHKMISVLYFTYCMDSAENDAHAWDGTAMFSIFWSYVRLTACHHERKT